MTGIRATALAVMAALPMAADAQTPRADEFLTPYGLEQFPDLYRLALETFLAVEEMYDNGQYGEALELLDELWEKHPPAGDDWATLGRKVAGLNIGSPPCYYALRMYTECARWRVGSGDPTYGRRGERSGSGDPQARTATGDADEVVLTVVVIGKVEGTQPTTFAELEAGEGREVALTAHSLLLADDHRVIHESLALFNEYMLAATGGKLSVKTEVAYLPDFTAPARAAAEPHRYAGLAGDAVGEACRAAPEELRARTDWWWVLYPSFVPGQYPEFETTEFITGGMGRGPDGGSPCFIIDDLWLVRKPPHLGTGTMTDIERRTYLPQWVQHEFYHHIFQRFPEYGLEAEGHQWFRRDTWPDDFVGRFEPDYYDEALQKRVKGSEPPMHVRLRYAPPPKELYGRIEIDAIVGEYRHEPVQNDWHEGRITRETGDDGETILRWTNEAGASWTLTPDLENGVLNTGEENPYYEDNPATGRTFRIVLQRDEDGEYMPELAGFQFQWGYYARVDE
ncbi:MAG TPA: hypothetical protein QGH10_00875 [Armatimonadota bacterium]|nr:hypothetical protein [Armatimonadota bacterium]